ncbi:MAG: hypothetical protein H7840_16425 [Alphaproteobacteria bacterium]
MTQAEQIQRLIETAEALAGALAQERENNRRERRRARRLALGLVAGMAVAGVAGWEMNTPAEAQTNPIGTALAGHFSTWQETKQLIVAMSHIAVFMDQMMQGMAAKAQKEPAFAEALASFAPDTVTLVHRITQDSTVWRKELARRANVTDIESELASPGLEAYRAYISIPQELNFINKSMWVMTNTAGRMGSWIPY